MCIYAQQLLRPRLFGIISDLFKPFLISELVVLGDLNLDSDQFKNICLEFNSAQLITKPTRINVKKN